MAHSEQRLIVVGTAGHVDHGKSTLVKALTGVDPDRLPQEKERGMSIELGFANRTLPSGCIASFVDVPGHERFVATMIAGATGVDAAMLVVAADEGIMPQTREHLAVLDLLGIDHGIVVVTKSDLVEIDGLETVAEDIRNAVSKTCLRDAAIIPVSARSGDGLTALLECLDALPPIRRSEQPSVSRLVVDRVFSRPGFGTVVTGPTTGQGFSVGEEVMIYPGLRRARIRGLQQHGQVRDTVARGRAALNLSGIGKEEIARSNVISYPGLLIPCRRFDAEVTVLGGGKTLERNEQVTVHAGTNAVPGRIFPLDEAIAPGTSGWARIHLSRPSIHWRGQCFVLRRPAPIGTIAGGVVADLAPSRRTGSGVQRRLKAMLAGDAAQVVSALLELRPLTLEAMVQRLGLVEPEINRTLTDLLSAGSVVLLGRRYHTARSIARLTRLAVSTVGDYRERTDLDFMPREELRQATKLTQHEAADLFARLIAAKVLTSEYAQSGKLLPNSQAGAIGLPRQEYDAEPDGYKSPQFSAVVEILERGGFQPTVIDEALREAGADRTALQRLEATGQVVRIEGWLYLSLSNFRALLLKTGSLLEQKGSFTVAELRDELATSRKYALSFVAYLDSHRITRREGDNRVAGKNLDEVRKQFADSG